MAAIIRSLRNGINQVIGASRDDLVAGDVVTVNSVDAATTYNWALVFIPEGSTAAFSGDPTAASPGDFTVDLEGPYLVRLVTDLTLPTISTQYVRLRALTTKLGLRLAAAGERRDGTGIIPVDIDPGGWADEQNANLQSLELLAGTVTVHDEGAPVNQAGILDFVGGGVVATTPVLGTARVTIPGGFGAPRLVVATPDAVGIRDGILLVNVAVPSVINLPAIATYTGPGLRIKDRSGAAFFNPIRINAHGGETIDGAGFITLAANYASVDLVPLGTEWSAFG